MVERVSLGRLSTAAISPADRFDYWEHSISSQLQPVHIQPVNPRATDFRAEFVKVDAHGTMIAGGVLDPVRSEVTRAHAHEQDASTLSLGLQTSRSLLVEARGERHQFSNQTLLVQSDDEPTVHTHSVRAPMILMTVRTAELSLPMTVLRQLMFRPLPLNPALCALLAGAAQRSRTALDAVGFSAYLHGIAELVLRTVIGQQPDHSGTAAVRRQQARDVIRARIADPSLTTATVADELGLSVRRLQQIFEGEASIAQQIRDARIDRARRLLQDPLAQDQAIATIARSCGFGDHANFSRSFRRATGMAPRDFRG